MNRWLMTLVACAGIGWVAAAQQAPPGLPPSRGSVLRRDTDRYRANNDLLDHHLDIRVDPATKLLTGKNTVRFKMLKDDTRIRLDLYANMTVDRILLNAASLK